jgi:hypothetical protein
MDKYSFENFIKQCCKAKEWNLRSFLQRTLEKNGFSIIEDDYNSAGRRGLQYKDVNNLLAIRGKPRVGLVAHTDVCRDHAFDAPDVYPTTKSMIIRGEMRDIIQDKDCRFQLGGDDRLGVAINTYIALNSGYDIALLFTTDEEVGAISAEYVKFPELLDLELLVQVDRGNHSDQLVTSIGGRQICNYDMSQRLLKIAENIGMPRYTVNGMLTDVVEIHSNGMCKNAVNMTCGYHNSYGTDSTEYIDIQEAKDTMKYVSNIVRYFYLEEDKTDNYNKEDIEEDEEETEHYSMSQSRQRRFDLYNDGLFSEVRYNKDKGYYEEIEEDFGRIKF